MKTLGIEALKQQIEAVNEKIKSHVCRECGYASSRKSNLNQHIESVHEFVASPIKHNEEVKEKFTLEEAQ